MNNKLNHPYSKVKEFHTSFFHPVKSNPMSLTKERAKKRYNWLLEEINEFIEANEKNDVVEQADAMIDTIYFALGTLVEMGIKPQNLFDIVQNANMSKLWSDGKPHYKEDGKIKKPETWVDPAPLLRQEILNQMNCNNKFMKRFSKYYKFKVIIDDIDRLFYFTHIARKLDIDNVFLIAYGDKDKYVMNAKKQLITSKNPMKLKIPKIVFIDDKYKDIANELLDFIWKDE